MPGAAPGMPGSPSQLFPDNVASPMQTVDGSNNNSLVAGQRVENGTNLEGNLPTNHPPAEELPTEHLPTGIPAGISTDLPTNTGTPISCISEPWLGLWRKLELKLVNVGKHALIVPTYSMKG